MLRVTHEFRNIQVKSFSFFMLWTINPGRYCIIPKMYLKLNGHEGGRKT